MKPLSKACTIAASCPAVYDLEDGKLLIIGKVGDHEAYLAGAKQSSGEHAIIIDASLVAKAISLAAVMSSKNDLREGTVADISDEQLLRRAVANCRNKSSPSGVEHPRWTAVHDTFALGSTYAHQLCRRFGFDPNEMVVRYDHD